MKCFFRSLAHRFLVCLAGLLLLAIAALFLIERLVVMPVLLEEENHRASQEMTRISQALEHNQNSLLAQARDWAHWDDTYEFVQGRHATYSSANFSREMFEDMHYQLMVFFTAEQEVHWVAGIDPATGNMPSAVGPVVTAPGLDPFWIYCARCSRTLPNQGSPITSPGHGLPWWR